MSKKLKCINKAEEYRLVEYEQGWMKGEEAQAFEENHLARCAACRENLAFFKPVWARLCANPEILKNAERCANERAERRSALFQQWSLAAAVIAVFAIVVVTYSHHTRQDRWEYAQLAALEDWEIIPYRCGDVSENPLRPAQRSFATAKYTEAVEQLKAIIEKDPANEAAIFYLGLSYLRLGQNQEAVAVLRPVAERSQGILRERSRWNLANAYLKVGDPVHSREELEALLQEVELNHPYRVQAATLIKKIDQLQKVK